MLVGRVERLSGNGVVRVESLFEAAIDDVGVGVVQQHGGQQHGRGIVVVV